MDEKIRERLTAFRKELADKIFEKVAYDAKQDNTFSKTKYHSTAVEHVAKAIETDNDAAFARELFKDVVRSYADNEAYCARIFEFYGKRPEAAEELPVLEAYYSLARKEFHMYHEANTCYVQFIESYHGILEGEMLSSVLYCTMHKLKEAQGQLTLPDYVGELSRDLDVLQKIYIDNLQEGKCN